MTHMTHILQCFVVARAGAWMFPGRTVAAGSGLNDVALRPCVRSGMVAFSREMTHMTLIFALFRMDLGGRLAMPGSAGDRVPRPL